MRRLATTTLLLALAFSQGCALLLRGKTDTIEVSGVQLEVDGKPVQPGAIELRRRQVHVVSGVVNGQRETRTVESDLSGAWFAIDFIVFGVFLAPIGSIMFIVDLATGSLNDFDTTEVAFPTSKPAEKTDAPRSDAPGSALTGQRAQVCSHCGTALGERAKFCQECGARR